jgi:hypothetical protein
MNYLRQQFICVGAARCGTTSLWGWLGSHPSVHMSPIKETNYFARDLIKREGPGDRKSVPDVTLSDLERISPSHAGIIQDEMTYRAALTGSTSQCCGEISPSYLFYAAKTASRIHMFNPDCKIVILLREPASRALSQHAIFTAAGRENLTFKDALEREVSRLYQGWEYGWAYKGLGLYHEAVRTYLCTFGPEKVWVGLYDDLQAFPQKTFNSICSFLGLDTYPIDSDTKVHQSPPSIGPLLQLSRTKMGRIAIRLTPERMKRWLRFQDDLLKRALEKHGQREIKRLRTFYAEDIVKLDELLPTLGIKARWNY